MQDDIPRDKLTGPLRRETVKKNVAAIHVSGKLTLLQRKLSNVLLLNAYDTLISQPKHQIDARTLALMKLARVKAVLDDRRFVIPEDVKAVAVPALAHRFGVAPMAPIPKRLDRVSAEASERVWMNIPPARVWVYRWD